MFNWRCYFCAGSRTSAKALAALIPLCFTLAVNAQTFEVTCNYVVEDTRKEGYRYFTNTMTFIDGMKDHIPCQFTGTTIDCAVMDDEVFYVETTDRRTGRTMLAYGRKKHDNPDTRNRPFVVLMQGDCTPTSALMDNPDIITVPRDQLPSK